MTVAGGIVLIVGIWLIAAYTIAHIVPGDNNLFVSVMATAATITTLAMICFGIVVVVACIILTAIVWQFVPHKEHDKGRAAKMLSDMAKVHRGE